MSEMKNLCGNTFADIEARDDIGLITFYGLDADTTAYGYTVSKKRTRFSLNGTSTGTVRWKLTGEFAATSVLANAENWDKDLYLPAGKYIVSFDLESGSANVDFGGAFIRGYDVNKAQFFNVYRGESVEFVWPGGNILIIQSNDPATYSNAVYRTTLHRKTDGKYIEQEISPAWIDYGMVNKDTGEITSSASIAWKYTPFYELPTYCKAVKLSAYAYGSSVGVAFYDTDAVYIGGVAALSKSNSEIKIYSVPTGAKYIRFTNNIGTNYHPETPIVAFLSEKEEEPVRYKKIPWRTGIMLNNAFTESNKRLCTAEPIHIDRPVRISLADDWRAWVSYYSGGEWVKDGVQAQYVGYVPEGGYDIYITVGKRDNSVVTNAELATASESIAVILNDNAEAMPDWSSMSMFQRIGVLGDSFASGSLHHLDGSGSETNYNLSWPQILGRDIGAEVTNYSKGGLSATTWLSNADYGLAKLLAEDAEQLYICAFGINDWNTRSTYPIGTVADCKTDFTQNPATFYGSYGKVIGNIKAHAPNAKIVLLTVMRENERQLDGDIKAIADHFGIPCINVTDDDFFVSEFYAESLYENHPVSYGYAGIAASMKRLLCRCVMENTDYFGTYYGG